jgi:3-oxoacyl-[acyl-carrier protein] reductase
MSTTIKYALVTGGSRGIGRAIAERLACDGYYVVINYKSNDKAAQEVLQMIIDNGGQAELLKFDVTDESAISAAYAAWCEQHPDAHFDVLINNAGIRRDGLMVFMSHEDWSDVMHTNLDSFFYLTKLLLQPMIRRRHGRIVNITSISGVTGLAGQVNYSSAKAALIGATKALSKELAGRKITVNAVAPGFIATDMTAELDETELKKTIPMGRFGTAQEVADLVSFLVSDKASYITGQVINIAGGIG